MNASAGVVSPDPSVAHDVVAEVMTAPVVTTPDSGSIWDAWSVMFNRGVRHAVVVSGDHCVGVVDDRELVQAWQRGPTALHSTPIRQLLHARTSCVLPHTPLREVAALMNAELIDAVPVVDATGKLLGLITAGDVVHAVARLGLYDDSAMAVGPTDEHVHPRRGDQGRHAADRPAATLT